jgi:hypothetical protein
MPHRINKVCFTMVYIDNIPHHTIMKCVEEKNLKRDKINDSNLD